MKPYAAFSREAGAFEGAVLVIASTAREARRFAWGHCLNVDDFLDQAVRWLRDDDILALADQEKLAADIPHVIDNPPACAGCGYWGEVVADGDLCKDCAKS